MQTLQIFVADDEEIDRYIVQRVAKKWPQACEIYEFTCGEELLDVVLDLEKLNNLLGDPNLPIIVLLDINMPRGNGFEVLEAVKRHHENGEAANLMMVLMFTSSDNPEDQARARSFDFVKDYCTKPLTLEDLDRIYDMHEEYQVKKPQAASA